MKTSFASIITGNLCTSLIITGATFLSSVLVSRGLGPNGRGDYLYIYNFIALASGLGTAGLPEFVGLLIVRWKKDTAGLRVFLLAGTLALIGSGLAAYILDIWNRYDAFGKAFCILWPVTSSIVIISQAIFQARGRWLLFNYIRISFATLFLGSVAAFLYLKGGTASADLILASAMMANLVAAGSCLCILRKVGNSSAEKIGISDLLGMKTVLVSSVVLQLLAFFAGQFDVALVALVADTHDLAYFSVAKTVALVVVPFSSAFSFVSFRYRRIFGVTAETLALCMAVFLSLVLYLFSPWVSVAIQAVYGSEFSPAAAIFEVYWPAAVAIASSMIVEEALRGQGRQGSLIAVRMMYVFVVLVLYYSEKVSTIQQMVSLFVLGEIVKFVGLFALALRVLTCP